MHLLHPTGSPPQEMAVFCAQGCVWTGRWVSVRGGRRAWITLEAGSTESNVLPGESLTTSGTLTQEMGLRGQTVAQYLCADSVLVHKGQMEHLV